MAASKKRRVNERTASDSSGSENNDTEEEDDLPQEQVQVDFEARCPDDSDFHGINQLLQQLFLKAQVNVSQLTDLLIRQNKITSVLKTGDDDDDSESDDDDSGRNFCFGVASVVNITDKRDMDCIKELKNYLLDKCSKTCSSEEFSQFREVLENEENHIGFILNERLMNIPAQISLPLFESLSEDMKAANSNQEKPKFNFAHYLLICKTFFDKNKPDDESNLQYINAEEELIVEEASFKFDFSVAGEQDSRPGGGWTDDEDMELHPKRRVVLIPAYKWETVLAKLKNEFSNT